MGGVVLSRSAEPGEYLTPSTPVVTLGALDHPWLRAFINEKDLGRIRLKDKVTKEAATTDGPSIVAYASNAKNERLFQRKKRIKTRMAFFSVFCTIGLL